MDPNNPNNTDLPNDQSPPPLAPDDPKPEDLTADALYGPSDQSALPADPNAASIENQLAGQTSANPGPEYNEMAVPAPDPIEPPTEPEFAPAPIDETQPDYYQPDEGALPPAPPADGTPPGGSLPPIPTQSKMPLIIIGVAVVIVLLAGIIFTVLLLGRRGSSTKKPTTAPIATEQPISCQDDPSIPGCTTVASPTPSPLPTPTEPHNTLSPQQCQLIYGGPCP